MGPTEIRSNFQRQIVDKKLPYSIFMIYEPFIPQLLIILREFLDQKMSLIVIIQIRLILEEYFQSHSFDEHVKKTIRKNKSHGNDVANLISSNLGSNIKRYKHLYDLLVSNKIKATTVAEYQTELGRKYQDSLNTEQTEFSPVFHSPLEQQKLRDVLINNPLFILTATNLNFIGSINETISKHLSYIEKIISETRPDV